MKTATNLSRRSFIVHSVALGAGLALGFELPAIAGHPGDPSAALAQPEIGAWVVIRPNDDVIIRIVRSEMGQGTITGLCQLVGCSNSWA